jgi:hypothetical protein
MAEEKEAIRQAMGKKWKILCSREKPMAYVVLHEM